MAETHKHKNKLANIVQCVYWGSYHLPASEHSSVGAAVLTFSSPTSSLWVVGRNFRVRSTSPTRSCVREKNLQQITHHMTTFVKVFKKSQSSSNKINRGSLLCFSSFRTWVLLCFLLDVFKLFLSKFSCLQMNGQCVQLLLLL